MVKQILALVSLLLLTTACAEDSVLYLEGPDKVTLDETVDYIATVENAPPVVIPRTR